METLIAFLLNPNIAYLGLVTAFLTSILALLVPGTGLLEITALVTVVYSAYAVVNIPVNPIALLILIIGVIPFAFALRKSGNRLYLVFSLLALILGSSYLFVGEGWKPAVNPYLAVVVSILTVAFTWFMYAKILGAEKLPPAHNPDSLVGLTGEAATEIQDEGSVQIRSELWSARSKEAIPAGAEVRITGREGFTLIVEMLPAETQANVSAEEIKT